MTLIPELREELAATAGRDARAHRARRRRWLAGIVPVALVAGTTAALAAGGVIRLGAPAEDPPELARHAPSPDSGTGVVPPGRSRLLAVRAPDPDGGPPWGMQLSTTTRGLGCLLVGRVAGGRIGALGRDGAYGNDGRLHPYPDDVSRGPGECAPLDAGDRLYLSVVAERVPANAARLARCAPERHDPRLCLQGDERTILYGTLGPQARSVTYEAPGGPRTVPTVGPEGAYLIVLPAGPDEYAQGFPARYPTDGRILGIRFRDGRTCSGSVLRSQRAAAACPLPGLRPLPIEPLTRAQLAAKVTATARQGRRFWNMTVRFRAPVAITDATAAYHIRIGRIGSGRGSTAFTDRNFARGEQVTRRFQHLNGGGVYSVRVTFHRSTEPGNTGGPLLVGRFRLRIP